MVEPLWNGPPWYQRDCVLGAEGQQRSNVIATVRGLPADVSDETVEAIANELLDRAREDEVLEPFLELVGLHVVPLRRPSWLTLRELVDFDWDHEVDRSGWLPISEYARFLERGIPELDATFSIDQLESESEDYAYLTKDEARRLIAEDAELRAQRDWRAEGAFVRIEWREPYVRAACEFVRFTKEKLVPLGTPDSVRIIFLVNEDRVTNGTD